MSSKSHVPTVMQRKSPRPRRLEGRAEIERLIRGFGGRFSARGIQRSLRPNNTMMSDAEVEKMIKGGL